MSTLDTPKFVPAHADFPHYVPEHMGVDLASNPNLYTEDYSELLSSLYWEIKKAGYPNTRETLGLVQYVTASTKDEFGNYIFACVNYDTEGHLCTMGGHSAPVGDAGEGHTIIWSCYMD